jgi:hypothetical protein
MLNRNGPIEYETVKTALQALGLKEGVHFLRDSGRRNSRVILRGEAALFLAEKVEDGISTQQSEFATSPQHQVQLRADFLKP